MDGFDEATVMHTYDQLTSKVAAIVPCGNGEGKFDEEQWLQSKVFEKYQGVSIGGGIGSISDILDAAQLICDKVLSHIILTCATGAHSIGDATRMIQFGDADVMVAGGAESSIDALSIAGFCRIGEGSGIMVLESNFSISSYILFNGLYFPIGDAYHITQPHVDGKGAILAMTRALEQLLFDQAGDAVEANAIKSVFSGHATSGALALSSTKVLLLVLANLLKL
ncbi:hypothetical protein GW17_00011212 [Ensete ventricosum]|nr:hypothetical protein GW17_00011212 [Ensete ventricosum]